MDRQFIITLAALVVGVVLGNLSGRYGASLFPGKDAVVTDSPTQDTRITASKSDASHATSRVFDHRLPATKRKQSATDAAAERRSFPRLSGSGDLTQDDWEELYPDAPPPDAPHATDPYFFGPDLDDPDVIRARDLALEEHVASMREAGVPEDDIRALYEEFEDEMDSASPEEVHDEFPPTTLEEQARDDAESLRDAGEPEDSIQQTIDDFWAQTEELEQQAAEDDMRVIDLDTGLDHDQPP